ncbi:asparaginase [Lagierella massiliensis]|uniref:asparaginase n=1 Tax=Lagierella massiliensis TaxID=1689303 RepID=UPI0006D7DCE1|nr:asparaginase [Lagierella massiliensis]
MKNILMISTGGTIASVNKGKGLAPGLNSRELVEYLSLDRNKVIIDTLDLMSIDSTDIQVEDWLKISNAIKNNYSDYDGFVITHGTDTLAYTACAISYLIQNSKKPIVLTGAQKSIFSDITDAKLNLTDSITYVCDDRSRDVNIVFNGKVIAGTRGRKEKTKSYDAFTSLNYPVLATVHDDKIIRYLHHDYGKDEVKFYDKLDDSIFLLKLIPTIEPELLSYIFKKYKTVIVESYGVGGIPSYLVDVFKVELEEDRKLNIVITTQVPMEGSDISVYEVGRRLDDLNIMESFDMTLEATVVKLMWAMAESKGDFDKLKKLFYTQINYDTLYEL